MVLDPANGVAKGEGGCLLLQHVRSSAVEEHDWETLVHSCENRGEHRPVAECSRHNWCSVGVTASFETAPFICKRSVLQDDTRPIQYQVNATLNSWQWGYWQVLYSVLCRYLVRIFVPEPAVCRILSLVPFLSIQENSAIAIAYPKIDTTVTC